VSGFSPIAAARPPIVRGGASDKEAATIRRMRSWLTNTGERNAAHQALSIEFAIKAAMNVRANKWGASSPGIIRKQPDASDL
jgi:hypothetical protein